MKALKFKKVIAGSFIVTLALMLILPGGGEKVVIFADNNLKWQVRLKSHKLIGYLYKSDVKKITKFSAGNKNIKDINGIENLTNLKELDLSNTQISDISVLSGLINLKELNLHNTKVININLLKDTLTGCEINFK